MKVKLIELEGKVVDVNGDGINEVDIVLKDGAGTQVATAKTNPSGEFKIGDLKAGDYKVFASKANYVAKKAINIFKMQCIRF